MRRKAYLSVMFLLMLSACAVGPDFVRPSAPETDHYTNQASESAPVTMEHETEIKAQRFLSGAQIPADWWTLFKSDQLNAIVGQAIKNNPTLEASIATLHQSQNNLNAGYGVFYPQINAGLSGSRERTVPLQQGLQTPGTIFNLVTLSGSIGYTLDIFGGERRAVEGLKAQTDYQLYATKAAYVTLSANVVNASIARAAYRDQIRTTGQLIALELAQLEAANAQVTAGTASYSGVLSIRSLIAANQAALASLKQQLTQTENLLATLVGKLPSDANLPDITLTSFYLPTDIPVSLPSDLVRQRPDILEAEAQMHVASANIGVATAALFPSFSLTGTYGAAGTSFGHLSAESGRFWNIGPSISFPLFHGGSLWSGRKAAIDAYQASQANYSQTVLSAFAQVANALKALEHDAELVRAQTEAQRDAFDAVDLLHTNYLAGTVAYLDVLVADAQYHQATIGYLQAIAQRYQDTVALFVALGGGWWNAPEGKTP